MKRNGVFIAVFLAAVFLATIALSGCSGQGGKVSDSGTAADTSVSSSPPTQKEEPPVTETEAEPKIDYKGLKVNESGKIMILMYHGIGDEEQEWVRTADNFRKDLQTLYDKGYRTISLHDYINNNINTPAGFTPVVITFDDGLQNQFNYIEKDGQSVINPNCAVGIMQSFAKEHEGFGNAATFFVYYPVPFGQKDMIKEKFQYLIDNGFDIGNHSYTHEMLNKMDADGIQRQLGLNVKMTDEYLPGYNVDTLALPYGSRPQDEELRKYIISGEYDGTKYSNNAVLLVGANPALAPGSKDLDLSALPRVRASEMKTDGVGLYDWLKFFDKHPEQKYISDGDPYTVVIPEGSQDKMDSGKLADKKTIIY